MHCVNIFVLRTQENIDLPNARHGEYLLVPIHEETFRRMKISDHDSQISLLAKLLASKSETGIVARCETDYFGGVGEQAASIWGAGGMIESFDSINQALKKICVTRMDNMDEFDTVGIGRYRTNEDIVHPWIKRQPRVEVLTGKTYLLDRMPREVEDLLVREERYYINQQEYMSVIGQFRSWRKETTTALRRQTDIKPAGDQPTPEDAYSVLIVESCTDADKYRFERVHATGPGASVINLMTVIGTEEFIPPVHEQLQTMIVQQIDLVFSKIGRTGHGQKKQRQLPIMQVVYTCNCGKPLKELSESLECECGNTYEKPQK